MGKHITIIGASMHWGQPRKGVDMGPDAIRYAGAVEKLKNLGLQVEDLGNINPDIKRKKVDCAGKLNNLSEVTEFNIRLAEETNKIAAGKSFPLILGGDHSIAIGTVAGISHHYKNLGIIWFDAHGDLNTPETSPSGNIHGMPLAVSLGFGEQILTEIGGYRPKVKAENIVLIGVRELDDGEKTLIRHEQIKVYTMQDVNRYGMRTVMEETIQYFQKQQTDGVHLSFDLDSADPFYAPGVGTPVAGGLSDRECRLAMEMLAGSNLVTSAEFVEVNPLLDDRNKTSSLAADLIASLFGERLLQEKRK